MNPLSDTVALFDLKASQRLEGQCFLAHLPLSTDLGSSSLEPYRSTVRLFEDGRLIGPPFASHADIISSGGGAYSHWGNALYFSSSDGTDPTTNGRQYTLLVQERVERRAQRDTISRFEQLPDKPATAEIYRAVEETLRELYPLALMGEDAKSFWLEQELVDTYTRLCGSNRRSFERKFALINLLKLTHKLSGDIAECGAYEGATACMIADELRRAGVSRKIHLFDSFEGLSEPGEKDGTFWSTGGLLADENKARQNLAGFSNAAFYRGWIPERFPEVDDRTFAMVHIDVDLYQPTLDSLAFFYPRMVKGGLIVCDDYGFTTCPGAREAMDSFFEQMPESVVHLPTGQGLVLKE